MVSHSQAVQDVCEAIKFPKPGVTSKLSAGSSFGHITSTASFDRTESVSEEDLDWRTAGTSLFFFFFYFFFFDGCCWLFYIFFFIFFMLYIYLYIFFFFFFFFFFSKNFQDQN